jgi:cytochrome oxidase Cu insertion factor (SCO1/SenC/PrrC family)
MSASFIDCSVIWCTLRRLCARLCLALLIVPVLPSVGAAADSASSLIEQFPLAWQDEHGATVRLSDWRDRTVLLTMAYSTCREVCTYALHRLEELQQSADRSGKPIEVVVISYDPAIDSPGSWAIYRLHHHFTRSNWHFLTGSAATTHRFAQELQFPSWHYDEHVEHDFRILMIAPGGQVTGALDWAHRNHDFFKPTSASCPSSDSKDCKL